MAILWLKYLYYFVFYKYIFCIKNYINTKVKTMQFKDLELSQEFTYKGHNYIKNSGRTAKMLSNNKVCYFASYATIYVWKVVK